MIKVQIEDCRRIGELDFINWEQFRDKTVLITGATGLIGTNLVNALAYNNKQKALNIRLTLPVRNVDAAKEIFDWVDADIIPYELGTALPIEERVDYIVHLASPTSSQYFTERPVDTMLLNIEGYRALLEWAVKHPVKKFIGLSTMEVYGFPEKGHKVVESELGSFETTCRQSNNPNSIRFTACTRLRNYT